MKKTVSRNNGPPKKTLGEGQSLEIPIRIYTSHFSRVKSSPKRRVGHTPLPQTTNNTTAIVIAKHKRRGKKEKRKIIIKRGGKRKKFLYLEKLTENGREKRGRVKKGEVLRE